MYEQIDQEHTSDTISTFDRENVPAENPSHVAQAHTHQSDSLLEDTASGISTANTADMSTARASESEGRDIFSKKVDNENHATLTRSTSHEWFSTFFDALLSVVPLFFLIIAILCLCLDKKPVSSYGQNVKAITLLSPTIFPIVYAAILGKALRRVGLFKAERSSTIGTLEQLIGSQSFFSSIERQFGLHRVNFLGAAIIAAWLLSPLGGQSSLRLLSTTLSTITFNATIKYHSIKGFENDTMIGFHMEEYSWSRFAPLYMTALQTSRQTFEKPQDLFGNVRIPEMASLEPAGLTTDSAFEWRKVEANATTNYTSLLGRPIADIPKVGNVTLTLESSYWETRCEPFILQPMYLENNTSPYRFAGSGLETRSFYFDYFWGAHEYNISTPSGRKMEFSFQYLSTASRHLVLNSSCTATFRLVESEIGCENAVCAVRRIRNLDRDVTHWFGNSDDVSSYTWSNLFTLVTLYMPAADLKPGAVRSSEMVEMFMSDPTLIELANSGDGSAMNNWVNLSTLPTEVFSQRLQIAMNTFWDSTIGLQYRLGNLTTQDIANRTQLWNTTTATGVRHNGEEYECNITFAALTIAISLFLFVAGVVSLVLGFLTRAPNILGFVSTYARDDPYFGQHISSHMDGMETARALRDVRVMVGDVHNKEDVGHVAFASMEGEPVRVNKQRLYD